MNTVEKTQMFIDVARRFHTPFKHESQ